MSNHANPALEARMLADPDEPSSFLVYGDWLSEHGDPRGELVAVQAKLEEAPANEALLAKEAQLIAKHGATWLGAFSGKGPKDVAWKWRYGFLASMRLGPPLEDYETSELDFADAIAKLMSLPGTSFIRELVIGSKHYDDYPTSWDDVIAAMAEHGVPRGLRTLEFNRGGFWDISSTELGNLAPLYPKLDNLRELRIEMGAMVLGAIDLPELRALEIVTGGLTADNVASLCAAKWPNLERLSVCIGESGGSDYGCDVTFADVERLLAADNLGRLRHLGLGNSDLADQIAAALPASKLLAQLESLDLSRGTFSDEGARSILASAKAFAHLKQIDLTHSYVSEEVGAELSRIGPRIILDDPQEADQDGDEAYRYVQISE